MTCCALAIGAANHIDLVHYFRPALFLLVIGIALAFAAVALTSIRNREVSNRTVCTVVCLGLLIEALLTIQEGDGSATSFIAIATVACLGLSTLVLRRHFLPWVVAMAIIPITVLANEHLEKTQHYYMDVRYFQKQGSQYLLQGRNPYSSKYINLYEPGAPFYGPGIVDGDNNLTVGFPYPPISLLLVLPAQLLKFDLRYLHVAAIAFSALLVALARPGKLSAIAAMLLMVAPKTQTMFEIAWTEPLLILTFSFAMFTAIHWPRALPYALGIFLSTKQYAVLALPLLPLLIETRTRRAVFALVARACGTAIAINLPFVLWDPHAFYRSVVQFQFLQPFREDALSIAALIFRTHSGYQLPVLISLVVIVPVYTMALRRAPRTPAGFAAALTLACLLFFAFSKQAFCNYYYFTIATALWALASSHCEIETSAPPAEIESLREFRGGAYPAWIASLSPSS